MRELLVKFLEEEQLVVLIDVRIDLIDELVMRVELVDSELELAVLPGEFQVLLDERDFGEDIPD